MHRHKGLITHVLDDYHRCGTEPLLRKQTEDPLPGAVYEGRHEPLVTEEVFDRVQRMLDVNRNGTRNRTHDHYLEGVVRCHRCRGRHRADARQEQDRRRLLLLLLPTAASPHIRPAVHAGRAVETAVLDHYTTITLAADLRARIAAGVDTVCADSAGETPS